jgi:hypothetical protein
MQLLFSYETEFPVFSISYLVAVFLQKVLTRMQYKPCAWAVVHTWDITPCSSVAAKSFDPHAIQAMSIGCCTYQDWPQNL